MAYTSITSNRMVIDVPEQIAQTMVQQNRSEDIRFLSKGSWIDALASQFFKPMTIPVLGSINGIILLIGGLVLIRIPRRTKRQKSTRKSLLKKINQLRYASTISEMEGILIQVLNGCTAYSQATIHAGEVQVALAKASVSDPLIKSMLQWVRQAQMDQFSKEKSTVNHHSRSESLIRILTGIMKEVSV